MEQLHLPHLLFNCVFNCEKMAKRKTTEQFIADARKVHGDKYDYSKAEYVNSKTKVSVICPIHGEFEQCPTDHLEGHECRKCGKIKAAQSKRYTHDEFVAKASLVHKNKYDYSQGEYKGCYEPLTIICPIHGPFTQTPYTHIYGVGCPKCTKYYHKGAAGFLAAAVEVHGNKYDYSLADIGDYHTPVAIICKEHGVFWQRPYCHLQGQGCPYCKESHGEREIAKWLDGHGIKYYRQHKVHPERLLFGRNKFFVDFYLPDCKTFIEYNGEQHYKRIKTWHTEEQFQEQQDRDRRLREHCKLNGITLIEIPYTDLKDIDKILNKKIGLLP